MRDSIVDLNNAKVGFGTEVIASAHLIDKNLFGMVSLHR